MKDKTPFLISAAQKVYPKPTIVFQETPDYSEPVVFVANHEKNYGPSIMQLFFPITYRPWVIYRMLEPQICREYIREDFFEGRWNVPSPISGWISGLVERPLIRLMNSSRPIAVYRGLPQRIAQTFKDSLETLEAGENLLIFPENGEIKPYSQRVNNFHTGFIFLTKLYYRKTGKRLSFCPVSINPHKRFISVGKRVTFNPEADYDQERGRICQFLVKEIDRLYEPPWNKKEEPLLLEPSFDAN